MRAMDESRDSESPELGKGRLRPSRVAPLFSLTALFHAVCLVSRFDEVAQQLPAGVSGGLLMATFPLLLIEGYFEGRVDYGSTVASLPLWMRIDSKPVKLSFTFAFTYLAVVVLQTWDVSIGPIDPTPPAEWPLAQRAQFFLMMSVGMFFPNYLAATSLLVPVLRGIGRPFRQVPAVLATAVLGLLGTALGYGVGQALASSAVGSNVMGANEAWQSLTERPLVAIGLAFGAVLLPMIFGALTKSDD